MQFNIDVDSGGTVCGWLVLDNPSETPEFKILIEDGREVKLRANVFRKDLYDLGLHATGMAGFQIDEALIPDLPSLASFTLAEATTGLPIYRRCDPSKHVESKVVLIETGAMPQVKLLRELMAHFSLQYPMLDRFPMETIAAALGHHYSKSTVASGRINWARFSGILQSKEFVTTALLSEPVEDLAERLLLIKLISRQPITSFSRGLLERYEILVPAVEGMDLHDEKSILKGLRGLSREQRHLIKSPMTATFGATPDEIVQRRNVSIALDNLAQVDAVGIKSRFDDFAFMANGIVGVPIFRADAIEALSGASELAKSLGKIALVADLLDEDIALYSFVANAIATALGTTQEQDIHNAKHAYIQ
ncbi:hypothetical protein ASD00_17170 [Ensifer sp. Root31]|uniref:hypothetical protein n=1 Tax=Ensifer sp. Root31 TaxID=1736512 RepID=UPI00070B23D8|nr:hypothetical protein [Ensifer sp. Root31]KQU97719.1 hypothetical protein ASD00_17170 [Ensifer sp. Root31]